MRKINSNRIKDALCELAIRANICLRPDVFVALRRAHRRETDKRAKGILKILLENASIARKEKLPICQDTGMAVVFVELGNDIKITGGGIKEAINRGVSEGYKKGYLRKSVVKSPLERINTGNNAPAVIHIRTVKGNKLKITFCAKGFGAENKSQIKMFEPTTGLQEIKDFVLKVIRDAGPDACPPFVIGIGMGGTFEQAAVLAKEATLRKIRNPKSEIRNKKQNSEITKLETELLAEINKLNIGPMGLGGKTTCLGVNILTYPTHIAGLPVAVNLSCHATRSTSRVI